MKQKKNVKTVESAEKTTDNDLSHILTHSPIPHAKQYYTSKGCEECHFHVLLYDCHHAELVCPRCGLVVEYQEITISQQKLVVNNHVKKAVGGRSRETPYKGSGYTDTEKRFLKKANRKCKTFKNSRERRMQGYHQLLKVFQGHLHLSPNDLRDVYTIITSAGNLKRLHTRVGYECILLGVCRFISLQNHGTSYVCEFTYDIYCDVGLTEKIYSVIERNIRRVMNL